MGNLGKTTRTAIAIATVMAGFLWIGVTFVGESWSDQGRYVLTLLSLVVMMVFGAAVLVALIKAVGLLWDRLKGRSDPNADEPEHLPAESSAQDDGASVPPDNSR